MLIGNARVSAFQRDQNYYDAIFYATILDYIDPRSEWKYFKNKDFKAHTKSILLL